MEKLTARDIGVKGKRVLVRVDFNVPLDEKTQIGPQTSAQQLAKTQHYIQLGKDGGARLVTGGGRPAGLSKGYYVEPTIFAGVDNRTLPPSSPNSLPNACTIAPVPPIA